MRKIYIDKSDTVASVVERVLSASDADIVLYIPRFTKLATSNNFRLLKREIGSSGKNVEVESVDDEVLEMAKSVGINAANPFFRKNRRPMSDILIPSKEAEEAPYKKSTKVPVKRQVESEEQEEESGEPGEEPAEDEETQEEQTADEAEAGEEEKPQAVKERGTEGKLKKFFGKRPKPAEQEPAVDEGEVEDQMEEEMEEAEEEGVEEYHHRDHHHHLGVRRHAGFGAGVLSALRVGGPAKIIGVLVVAIGLAVAAAIILPKADIKVTLDKIDWDFNGSLVASASIKEPYLSNGQVKIAGVVLEKTKNITDSFPATGSESVSRKASGVITVYNAYSSEQQPLVKNTRFAAPDGKIFRIDRSVIIPGAKIVNNKIVPSSIDLTVYADKAGDEYNIAPATFRVPGLQGSPKYDGFYGESKSAMAGGAIGIVKVPTDGDIIKARDKNKKALEAALNAESGVSIPADIKVIDGATRFSVQREEVDKIVDDSGNFRVTTYGVKRSFGFKESDLIAALKAQVVQETQLQLYNADTSAQAGESADNTLDLDLKDHTITYGDPKTDFDNGEMSLSLSFKSVWTRVFDAAKFKEAVLGESASELNSQLKSFKGVKSIGVNLWPFWVRSVPRNSGKVTIDVQ